MAKKSSKKTPARLVLVDGHAIIHRAYHALPPLTSPSGQQTNAVYGFFNMLLKAIDELEPTHLVVTFDLPVPTFRHEEYIAYQAHRPHADQELKDQVDLVKEVVEAADIPVCTAAGFEADDVIGTIAKQAQKKVNEVIIVTGDRDILQLVNGKVKVYAPVRGLSEARLFGKKDVREYLGIDSSKVVDYKALIGDASDNYPGVPGIGPKTAISLLEDFGSLENIYRAVKKRSKKAEGLPPAVLQKLAEGYDSAVLSKKLAQIVTNAPVKLNLKEAKLTKIEGNKRLIEKLKEFGFRSLVRRVGGDSVAKTGVSQKKKGNGQMGLI